MFKRIRNLGPNLRLKIISLILAVAIWYMINYFSDPAIRMTVNNVSVQIQHGEVIENRGDVYTVLDNTDVIPVVTLQAKRSVIDKLEAKNVIATADAREMEDDGSIRIILTTDKYSSSVERITGSISHVFLRVEPLQTKSLSIDVDTEGTVADGYFLMDAVAEQNQVNLSGPMSYVENVERAAVKVDIDGAERNINSYPEIVLYDKEGNAISSEEMNNYKLRLNISSVKVAATIYQKKDITVTCGQEVPIADGYELVSGPTAEPATISVVGAAGILRQTDSIEIPAQDIASEPVSINIHKRINVKKYLPDGLYLPDENVSSVTVYLQVSKIPEQEEETEEGTEGTESSEGTTGTESSEGTEGSEGSGDT